MGLELLIWWLWVMQGVAGLVLTVHAGFQWRWFAAAGTLAGLAIGISPFFLMQGRGPAVWGPVILIVLISTVALCVLYGLAMRWKALVVTLLILAIPLAYHLFAHQAFPPSVSSRLTILSLLAQITYLLGPILCALAVRELLGWLDRLVLAKRNA